MNHPAAGAAALLPFTVGALVGYALIRWGLPTIA